MKQFIPIFALLISTLATPASANQPFKLGELGYAGNGCPAPTDTENPTIIRMNKDALSIIPTEMMLFTPSDERSFQRKKCDIALPIEVESGYQIRMVNTKLQAFAALDTASTATYTLDAGFAGNSFAKTSVKLSANTVDNTELAIPETSWSECGADLILRAKASMVLRSDTTQSSYLRVNGIAFSVVSQACSNANE